jgi:hypothetical protein
MASHGVSWTPGVHTRLGGLDYLTAVEGGQAPTLIQPPRFASLDVAVRALEKLQAACPGGSHPRGQPVSRLQLCVTGMPTLHPPEALAVLGGSTSLFFLLSMT